MIHLILSSRIGPLSKVAAVAVATAASMFVWQSVLHTGGPRLGVRPRVPAFAAKTLRIPVLPRSSPRLRPASVVPNNGDHSAVFVPGPTVAAPPVRAHVRRSAPAHTPSPPRKPPPVAGKTPAPQQPAPQPQPAPAPAPTITPTPGPQPPAPTTHQKRTGQARAAEVRALAMERRAEQAQQATHGPPADHPGRGHDPSPTTETVTSPQEQQPPAERHQPPGHARGVGNPHRADAAPPVATSPQPAAPDQQVDPQTDAAQPSQQPEPQPPAGEAKGHGRGHG